jgi:hypothetical protein
MTNLFYNKLKSGFMVDMTQKDGVNILHSLHPA